MTASVLASLLSACAKDNIVATPVRMPPVAPQLTEKIRAPLCELAPRPDYSVDEIKASMDCWKASFGDAAKRHESLSSAVRVREKAADSIGKSG